MSSIAINENSRHVPRKAVFFTLRQAPQWRRVSAIARVLGSVLVATVLGSPLAAVAQTNDEFPTLDNVTDIRLGRSPELLPVDDIVMGVVHGSTLSQEIWETQDGMSGTHQAFFQNLNAVAEPNEPRVLVERVYPLSRDVTVVVYTQSGAQMIEVVDFNRASSTQTVDFDIRWIEPGDFNGDGLTDLVIRADGDPHTLLVATPADLNDVTKGLKFGPILNLPSDGVPVAGDFNGDGRDEIALSAHGCNTSSDFTLQIYTVDPDTLAITPQGSTCEVLPAGTPTASRFPVAGHFVPITPGQVQTDQLAVVYGGNDRNSGGSGFFLYQVDPDTFTPEQIGVDGEFGRSFFSAAGGQLLRPVSGPVAWYGFTNVDGTFQQSDVLVLASEGVDFDGNTDINYISWSFSYLDTELIGLFNGDSIAASFIPSCGAINQVEDVALGNFDQNLGLNGQTFGQPPNLQIAFALQCTSGGQNQAGIVIGTFQDPENANFLINITNINPGSFSPAFTVPNTDGITAIATGDLQGRSLVLGPPEVLRFAVRQPDVIIAAPPQHVDYITPLGETEPAVLNITAVKNDSNGFSSAFDTQVTGESQSSRTGATSYTTGVKLQGEVEAELETRFVQAGGTLEAAVATEHEQSIEKTFSTYSGGGFDASSETDRFDLLHYQHRVLFVYAYPVIGQTACPVDSPNCTASEKLPVYIVYSAIGHVESIQADLSSVEWYQPPHEPGNILSYPASPNMLQLGRQQTNLNFDMFSAALTPTDGFTMTGDSNDTVAYEWSVGAAGDQSVGSSVNQSFDGSLSAYLRLGRKKKSGVKTEISGSLEKSSAFETLQTASLEIGASLGIEVNKPATFLEPSHYQYGYHGIVFGTPYPDNTLDTPSVAGDVPSMGAIELAFTADPTTLDPKSGDWWPVAYEKPDVALNHPLRWDITQQSGATSNSCLAVTGPATSCAEFEENPFDEPFDPTDLNDLCYQFKCAWTSNFHKMKGFFITSEDTDGSGPQRRTAVAGDRLRLTARVYNYSLADMPAGTEVHVRFYGQPMTSDHHFVDDPFLIDEVEHDLIPKFGKGSLNWELVSTTFDTTDYADTFLAFWVVVWMENNGQLVSEIEDHGLTAIPGTLANISEVPTEPHSNNVGLYNVGFYIFSADGVPGDGSILNGSSLSLGNVQVSSAQVQVNEKVEVRVPIHADGGSANGVIMAFYDGDPARGGNLFDVEELAHVPADSSLAARVTFRPRTCGTHELFVKARAAESSTAWLEVARLDAVIDPVEETTQLAQAVRQANLPEGTSESLLAKLDAAAKSFQKRNTNAALGQLKAFENEVHAQSGKTVPYKLADELTAESTKITSCLALQ